MAIAPAVDNWLKNEGNYEYHCFVSWPHTINPDLTACARAVKKAIEEDLAYSIHKPRVFLDESDITGGDDWKARLSGALCRSIAMVAICAPIYYRSEHIWCGLEWAAMEHLSSRRLQGKNFKAIIPLMVRKSDPLPTAVSAVQYIDLSKITTRGRDYFKAREFRQNVQEIVSRIEQVAEELCRSKSKSDCHTFDIPAKSAFSDHGPIAPVFPLIS